MRIDGGSFLVLGLSRSGIAVAELLLKHGAKVYLYDQFTNDAVQSAYEKLQKSGAAVVEKNALMSVLANVSVVVLSPGVPIDNSVAVLAYRLHKRIVGELELASCFLRAPAIAVTGTNGKTTTVGMIESIVKEEGVFLRGCRQ